MTSGRRSPQDRPAQPGSGPVGTVVTAPTGVPLRPDEGTGITLIPPGFCLNCGHHEDAHGFGEHPNEPRLCDTEVSDYGVLDCQCPGLRLCAECEGDPEALGLHVCGRAE